MLTQEAKKLFSEGKYNEAKKIYEKASLLLGKEIFKANIKLCENRLNDLSYDKEFFFKSDINVGVYNIIPELALSKIDFKKIDKNKLYNLNSSINLTNSKEALLGVQQKLDEIVDSYVRNEGVANDLIGFISFINSKVMFIAIQKKIHPFCRIKDIYVRNKEKYKILILTCLWGREETSNFFLNYFSSMRNSLKYVELDILAVGSEGEKTKNLVEAYNFKYVEYKNKPLSEKWQYGIECAREIEFDGLVILGSDDIINVRTMDNYAKLLQQGVLFYGFYDAYVYNILNRSMMYYGGYGASISKMPRRLGETVGLGRMLSRDLLEFIDFDIWKGVKVNSSLDGYMKKRITDNCMLYPVWSEFEEYIPLFRKRYIAQVGDFFLNKNLFCLGTKSDTNITGYSRFRDAGIALEMPIRNTEAVLKKALSKGALDKLYKLAKHDVTVIIMCHKESDYINECIKSVLAQNFKGSLEIILASDGCEKLVKYADTYNIIFNLSEKKGKNNSCSKNINDAVSIATGKFIKIIAYDDFLPESSLRDLYNKADQEKLDFVYANAYEYYNNSKIVEYKPPFKNIDFEKQLEKNVIHGGSILFKRIDFLEVGGFDESLEYAEEYDFYFKLLKVGKKFGYLDSFVYYYRRHKDQKGTLSLSDEEKKNKKEIVNIIQKKHQKSLVKESKPIVFGIATLKNRMPSLIETIKSIYFQADRIVIYQDDYIDKNIFSDTRNKIEYTNSIEVGKKLGDAGKYCGINFLEDCYYFTIDDDILYPSDYAVKTINFLKDNPGVFITYHGKIFKPNAKKFFEDIVINFKCFDLETEFSIVHFGGTGVMAFDTSYMADFSQSIFKEKNMADVWIGLYARQKGYKIIHVPHSKGWLKPTKSSLNHETIYTVRKNEENKVEDKLLRNFWHV